ncbi:MAG: putative Sec-independent protein translocase protein TatB [Actinomycetota bacterium]
MRSYAGSVFNLSGSEVVFLLVAGLVVLGPERLPGVIRGIGRTYGELRRMARGFEAEMRGTFDEPIRDLRETARDIRAGFGAVDTGPSPPMRPEQSVLPPDIATDPPAKEGSDDQEG